MIDPQGEDLALTEASKTSPGASIQLNTYYT